LVVGEDLSGPGAEAAFRAANGIPAEVVIYGPYDGALNNAGESIKLYRPGTPDAGTGVFSYIRVDRVKYDPATPWPAGADGLGPALAKTAAGDYGNDPAGWLAEVDGGTPGRFNVVDAGTGASVQLPSAAVLDGAFVPGSLPGPVTFQWTQQSGPAGVQFAAPSAEDTQAVFPTVGVYVLRLTADDGQHRAWSEVTVTVTALMGDANGDGAVGIADLVALAENYGLLGQAWAQGDFNGDGLVGIADLSALADNYGAGGGGQQAAAAPAPGQLPAAAPAPGTAPQWTAPTGAEPLPAVTVEVKLLPAGDSSPVAPAGPSIAALPADDGDSAEVDDIADLLAGPALTVLLPAAI